MIEQILRDPILCYYIAALAMAYPYARIVRRAGLSNLSLFYVLVCLALPMVGYIFATAVLAFQRWPRNSAEEKA
jgi:hypothetical protein